MELTALIGNILNNDHKPLLNYFSKTLIGIIYNPLFPIKIWNLNDRIIFNVHQVTKFKLNKSYITKIKEICLYITLEPEAKWKFPVKID